MYKMATLSTITPSSDNKSVTVNKHVTLLYINENMYIINYLIKYIKKKYTGTLSKNLKTNVYLNEKIQKFTNTSLYIVYFIENITDFICELFDINEDLEDIEHDEYYGLLDIIENNLHKLKINENFSISCLLFYIKNDSRLSQYVINIICHLSNINKPKNYISPIIFYKRHFNNKLVKLDTNIENKNQNENETIIEIQNELLNILIDASHNEVHYSTYIQNKTMFYEPIVNYGEYHNDIYCYIRPNLNKKTLINLFNIFTLSKQFCIYTIKNFDFHHRIKSIIKNELMYKTVIKCAINTLYTEEVILSNRKQLDYDSHCLFDIKTAMLLSNNGSINRYTAYHLPELTEKNINKLCTPFVIDNDNIEHNIIYDIKKSKERFELITKGVFANYDFNNVVVCGSILSTICVYNPLEQLYPDYLSFIDAHYNNYDIDVAIFDKDLFKVSFNKIYKLIKENIENLYFNNIITLKAKIFLNKQNLDINNFSISFMDSEELTTTFSFINNDILLITGNKKLIMSELCISYFKKSNSNYNIESNYIKFKIEIFKPNVSNPVLMISNFHLPCVRAFYNGKTVYMLPSFIIAALTKINIDYKYFSSKRHPIEIILKYEHRGYGTLLNKNEHINRYLYIKHMYNINHKTYNNLFMGYRDINHPMYKIKNNDYKNLNNFIYEKPKIKVLIEQFRNIYLSGFDKNELSYN
jgi:hypothetical protein